MAFFSASVLSAQFRDAIHSIRVHGEIESNGRTLNFSQVTKGQNHIRASILAPDGSVSVTVFFNQDKIYLEEDLPDNKSVRELSGEDAAAYLLDLLALNPAYHFRPNNGFNLRHPIFEGFSLEIKRVEASDPSDQDESSEQIRPIEQLRLIDLSVERDPILRTIRYLENFPEGKHGQTPRKIAFTDNSTGEGGTITLKDYNYNVGLPYFLFKPEGISSDSYK
jgi:hypothetical protein